MKKKILTADDIWATYEYWNRKALMQKGAYQKGQVEKWQKEFKEFANKRFVCIDNINDDLPIPKFAKQRIDNPENM